MPDYKICYTTDGSDPSPNSPVYFHPLRNAHQVRAAVLVQGRVAASADSRANAHSTGDNTALTAKAGIP
jgi:hypothetical protein